MSNAMLIDITRCVGCGECTRACIAANDLPEGDDTQLSCARYTVVNEVGNPQASVRQLCMHCVEPTCVSACLVGAFRKTATGAVVYDEEKCIGCRYCMQACPFSVPKYEWSSLAPRIKKCSFCHSRVSQGKLPACVEACPAGASVFGDRNELIREAHHRINENPGEYVDHVYGEHEAGGTSVLFLSAVPFGLLGFPDNLPTEPIPRLSWKILKEIPKYAVVSSLLLFGIHWITARRAYVEKIEHRDSETEELR
ncbi:MAG: 4Fe-4S dicluster domain-containing protein [Ignavibacteria bacterium]|nr:4Fe-4S dicluster domain-containing protein [Ignavibacteria bacterium]